MKYRAIIISPEQLMKDRGRFELMLRNENFASRIISIIFDEAHCISTWGSFRSEYSQVGRLRYLLPRDIPIMATSATLPKHVLDDVRTILRLRTDKTFISRRNCDRSNISLVVRPIRNTYSSFVDLGFLVRGCKIGGPPPKKFLVFFDDINSAMGACKYLRSLLPIPYYDKINWFCANMSSTFKTEETDNITYGRTWGLCTTESFGMVGCMPSVACIPLIVPLQGMDVADFEIIVQWRVTCSSTTYWQRGGRGARDRSIEATYILLVDREYFEKGDGELDRGTKRRRDTQLDSNPPAKRHKSSMPTVRSSIEEIGVTGVEVEADTMERDEGESDGGVELRRALQSKYFEVDREGSGKGGNQGRRRKKELDPVLADIVNAKQRGIKCRRIPILAALENEKAGEYIIPVLAHSVNILANQTQIITSVIVRHLKVVHVAPSLPHVYAATFVVLAPSQSSMSKWRNDHNRFIDHASIRKQQ